MEQGYIQYAVEAIKLYQPGDPILVGEIAYILKQTFALPFNKARAAACVCIKRAIERKAVPNLRRFERGIYYLTKETPFGETKINREKVIALKYILPNIGYETGPLFLHKLGLTTHMPNVRHIATNKAIDNTRDDKQLDIVLKKPRAAVNAENQYYLQFLDVLDCLDKIPIDTDNPYTILNGYIKQYQLGYDVLLAYAYRYYNKNVICEIAHVAEKGAYLI